jgi:hypothetical protein
MKLNLATVGFVLLGFALASPEPISEPEIEGLSTQYKSASTHS